VQILPILYAFLIFLFPLALYCLALAYLNRNPKPVLVSGAWDTAGLLFALSGFLLWTVPSLLAVFLGRFVEIFLGTGDLHGLQTWSWAIALGYYVVLVSGAGLMLAVRRHKTAIYNVDTERFAERLGTTLAELGLDYCKQPGRLVIAPIESFSQVPTEAIATEPVHLAKTLKAPPGGPRYAELMVDAFPAMCHVTLHWDRYSPLLRLEIEEQLARALEGATPVENPAAGWFLGFSGLILGTITMLSVLFVVLIVWRSR
jgi:hypothetical protein